MPERKSGRQRKAIDYGKFGGDDMDDDDFADSTPPPSKKTKLSSTKVKKTEKSVEKQVDNSSKRKSREDKLYERELQEALELSLSQESAVAVDTSQDELPPVLAAEESTTEPYDASASDTESPPIIIKAAPPSPLSPANDSDCIEILETDIVDKPATNLSKRRKTAPKKYIDSDSESDSDLPPMFGKSKASTIPAATTEVPTAEADNCIEVLKKDTIDIPASTTRRKAAPKKKYVDSDSEKDSDFSGNESASSDEDNSDDASDDDYNEADSDSDFGSSKKKTNKKQASKAKVIKKAPVAKKATAAKGRQQKSGQTATPSVTAPATVTSPPLATSSPIPRKPSTASVKTPTSTTPHTSVKKSSTNNQNWKPPGFAGDNRSPVVSNVVKRTPVVASCVGKSPGLGGVNLKSPNSGLRLGLSRNRKFKPLHPNLKINN